jgi:GT2 family glycosyltransferase
MISIIIVNFNTKDLTFECIKSIYQQTKDVEFQIVVVDNASNDDSVVYLRKSFPFIDIIESSSNLGFGRANNLGAKIAKGDFLFFLNSDTKLIENSIKEFHKFFVENENDLNLGVVGCQLVNENFQLNSFGDHFPTVKAIIRQSLIERIPTNFTNFTKKYFPKIFFKIKEMFLKNRFDENFKNIPFFEIDYVIGANLFLRKSLFNKFEGFSNDFFMYYEETDLQKRLAKAGFSRIIYNGTKIIHFGGGSGLETKKNLKRIINHQSRDNYIKKHDSKNYKVFKFFQFVNIIFAFFNYRYSFNENLRYQKAMFLFLIQKKIYGIHTKKTPPNLVE